MCQKSKKSKGENNNMGEDEQKLKSQFLPTSCLQVSHSQSHNLTQSLRSTSVEKYMRKFEKLLIECYIQKPKEQTIIRYLGGLDPRYYNLVKLQ